MNLDQSTSRIETDEKRKYWLETLSCEREAVGLPLEYERAAAFSERNQTIRFTIQDRIRKDLLALTGGSSVLVYGTAVTALATCLHKYTGATSIVVGGPVRKPSDGSFQRPNALPILVELDGRSRLRSLLGSVRERLLKAYANQDYSFQSIVRDLQINEVENRCPLFNVAIGLKSIHYPMPDVGHDVMITLTLFGDRLETVIDFNESILARQGVERFGRHFENLLGRIVSGEADCVDDLQMSTRAERCRIMLEWNETSTGYYEGRCVHRLIETQARLTPDSVAVVFEDEQLTYEGLNCRANQLARHLQAQGASLGTVVPVLMERSSEMVVALLGILKAGAAYLPLDPDYPRERIDLILRDVTPAVLVTQEYLKHKLPESGSAIVALGSDSEAMSNQAHGNFDSGVCPKHLAYVIYTSGSTGNPKGVMISHRAICNRLLWMQDRLPLTQGDRVLQKTTYTFDASVWEFFVPLMAGATVVMAEPGGHRDPAYMIQAITRHDVTILQLVPSMLRVLVEEPGFPACTTLKRVFCGGEALPIDLQERFFERIGSELHNLYGPTEAAIDATYWACERGGRRRPVIIGRPIANMQCYVLDERSDLSAAGAEGDLYLGGVGLANGYMGRPDLTAEKFIPHPFSEAPGARLYRTGDLVRHEARGEIVYIGRIDNQVKIRGFRIELGEIEAAVTGHPAVRAAAVVQCEAGPSDKHLVAYVIPNDDVSTDVLKDHLAKCLPDYMVPSAFVMLNELPLTPNGKLDRKSLPAHDHSSTEPAHRLEVPGNPVEEVLASIWGETLGLERIGVNQDFFELGGHSLVAMQIVSRARQAFEVKLPIRSLFDSPTVAGLARVIESAMRTGASWEFSPIVPASREGTLPLSFAQQRLWFLHQLDPITPLYNLPSAIAFQGRLNLAALEQTLSEIVRRHEALRTVLISVDGQPAQCILPPSGMALPLVDLRSLSVTERKARIAQLSTAECQRPFDLSAGPLLRATLLQLDDDEHALLFTMHHIVSDGWSLGVLINEVKAHYKHFLMGARSLLPELAIQYADYASWQRQNLQGPVLQEQLQYWETQLAGVQPLLKLSIARPRPPVQSSQGASRSLMIPKALSEEINALSRKEGVTLFMTLLAGFKCLLFRYSGQEDIIVGTPTANREQREIENLIGFFINLFPLRTNLSGNPSFRELLHRVRTVTLGAYAHQAVPYEKIVSHLQADRVTSHAPLFQSFFVLQNAPSPSFELPGLDLSYIPVLKPTTHLDFYFDITETANGLAAGLKYRTDLFNAGAISQFLDNYKNLFEEVVSQPDWRLLDIPLDHRSKAMRPTLVENAYQHQQFNF